GVAALLADGLGGVYAAVVELDPLPDAIGPRPEDDHAGLSARLRLVPRGLIRPPRPLPAGVVVGSAGGELRCAGVHGLERALSAERGRGLGDPLGQVAPEPGIDAG